MGLFGVSGFFRSADLLLAHSTKKRELHIPVTILSLWTANYE